MLEQESRIKTLTYDKIPDVMNDLISRIGKSSKNIKTGKMEHNNVDILLEDIKEIVNDGTNRNYSFALDVKNSPNYIYNLVMTKDTDGTIQEPVIIGYEMESENLEAFFENGEDYHYFITDYHYYQFDTFFEDSKFNRVGKSGDCGGGTTGGNTGGSSQTPPGGTFTHTYDGHTVTNIFSNDAVNISYGYTSTIRTQNAQVNTVSTTGTSGTVQISTPGPTGTLISHNVPPQTVSVHSVSEGNPSGPGLTCLVVTTFGDGHVTITNTPCQAAQQKRDNSSKSGDCTSPDGTFAINTAARSIEKLDYHLPGGLNAGQLNWFNDSNFPERKFMAQDLVWFLLDNNKSEESIIFVLMAVDALVNGGSVDVDDRLIFDNNTYEKLLAAMSPKERQIYDTELNNTQKTLYLSSAVQAYIYAETFYNRPVRNRIGDAVKHSMWNALSTARIGETLTKKLTDAHEDIVYDNNYPNHFKETQMDNFNNGIGRNIGKNQSTGIFILIEAAKNAGQLRHLSYLNLKNGFYNATDNSKLIPTN